MCCWHQLPSVLSRRAGRSRGPFPFVPTNILLIKSKLKLESRGIAVDVAMSPRNLGGKYRCRLHPRPRTCTRQFFAGIVDHVVCLKAEFLWHTVLSNENGEFYTYGIYPYLNSSVCLLMGSPTWWRFSFCSSGSSLVCSMMTWRTARARISNVRSPMLTIGFPLISGP